MHGDRHPRYEEFLALCREYGPLATPHCAEGYAGDFTARALSSLGNIRFCGRCGGSGWIMGYAHVEGGICFKCNGSPVLRMTLTPTQLKAKLEADPTIFTKRIALLEKNRQKKVEKDKVKYEALVAKRKAKQLEVLQVLSEEDRVDFLNIANTLELANADFQARYESMTEDEQRSHPYNKFPHIVKDILEKFQLGYNMSEKQLAVVLRIMRENAIRAEKLKNAPTYKAGEIYENVEATVVKMEEVRVEITSWITGMTTKVTMEGKNGERFMVKTDAARLKDPLREAMEGKLPIKFTGICKWVAPEGNMILFTPKKFRVTLGQPA